MEGFGGSSGSGGEAGRVGEVRNPQGSNQGRNQFFQGASHGQNPPPAYRAPAYQASSYQAPVQQASIPQPQVMTTTEFINYMKENDAILKNMVSPLEVELHTEVTKDTVPPTNNESTKDVQPPVVQVETQIPNFEPVVALVIEPVEALVSAPKPNPKPSISYPSRLHDQKLRDKANNQKDKFFQIFQDLNFNIIFTDALILMPKFGSTIKSLLTNKEKLFELAGTPLNEHCLAVLLKKLPKKIGDPSKFLISCNFLKMDECLALADLGASINLMPLSVWKMLSLLELSPTCMTLELADRSISHLIGVAEDVSVKVGRRALIDVYEGELTLRVGNKSIIFNLDQTARYSSNYNDMSVNQIDVIDLACEEYSQEVLGFSVSVNPTPSTKPIVFTSYPTLTPFGDSDFLLEETDAFLATEDEPISSEIDDSYYDSEGDVILLEEFPNDDPSSPPLPPQKLKGDDKLPIIIAKDLKDKEKTALIKVLKSHKQALAWQLSDIKGIDPEFCTLKILIEDDFKPAVQHQRKVNPKIHEVIKKEVLKLLDAELIYPISDSPWVSLMHYVPKKCGFTVVERNKYYRFLDGFSGYIQIPKDPQDQEKTTFTYPYGTFSYRHMPFGLCNASGTFQRCMMAIFHDMIEKMLEVFMDDFSVLGNSFGTCLSHLDKMLKSVKTPIFV
nr:reverse transcriptase domain-containing protein [Tanacetum cinerariifolium]